MCDVMQSHWMTEPGADDNSTATAELLGNQYFRRLWPASIFSSVCSSVELIAVLRLVYRTTGSAIEIVLPRH